MTPWPEVAWSAEGTTLVLAGTAFLGEEVGVTTANVRTRTHRQVCTFPSRLPKAQFHDLRSYLSPGGGRLLIWLYMSAVRRHDPRDQFSPAVEEFRYTLYEVELATGEVTTVRAPRACERRVSLAESAGAPQYAREERRPTPVGYDAEGRILLLENRSLVRLARETHEPETIVAW